MTQGIKRMKLSLCDIGRFADGADFQGTISRSIIELSSLRRACPSLIQFYRELSFYPWLLCYFNILDYESFTLIFNSK